MHKITQTLMPIEEPTSPTPCRVVDSDRWFPEEQKPDPYAVAACWSCYFQPACARRALTVEPPPEYGVWGGYRLAPGPGLERTRAQLAIVAGWEMGPAASPGREVTAALLELAGVEQDPQATARRAATTPAAAAADVGPYTPVDIGTRPVDLDDGREPTDEEVMRAGVEELAALSEPIFDEDLIDARGQILLPIGGWGAGAVLAPPARRRGVARGSTAVAKQAS